MIKIGLALTLFVSAASFAIWMRPPCGERMELASSFLLAGCPR
jgi:hypothetical protein